MASKPMIIRLIITGFKPYLRLCIVSYYIRFTWFTKKNYKINISFIVQGLRPLSGPTKVELILWYLFICTKTLKVASNDRWMPNDYTPNYPFWIINVWKRLNTQLNEPTNQNSYSLKLLNQRTRKRSNYDFCYNTFILFRWWFISTHLWT